MSSSSSRKPVCPHPINFRTANANFTEAENEFLAQYYDEFTGINGKKKIKREDESTVGAATPLYDEIQRAFLAKFPYRDPGRHDQWTLTEAQIALAYTPAQLGRLHLVSPTITCTGNAKHSGPFY